MLLTMFMCILVHISPFFLANLAQIAFESVVSIVNSLHNSQELYRDQLGRNILLATYLYWVFRLPDPPRDTQNAGNVLIISVIKTVFHVTISRFKIWMFCGNVRPGPAGSAPSSDSRYMTIGPATAARVGCMLLQSRVRSSSNPDIPAQQASDEDAEINEILSAKVMMNLTKPDGNYDLVKDVPQFPLKVYCFYQAVQLKLYKKTVVSFDNKKITLF